MLKLARENSDFIFSALLTEQLHHVQTLLNGSKTENPQDSEITTISPPSQFAASALLTLWRAIVTHCGQFPNHFQKAEDIQQTLLPILEQAISKLLSLSDIESALTMISIFNELLPHLTVSVNNILKILLDAVEKKGSADQCNRCHREILSAPIEPTQWQLHARALMGCAKTALARFSQLFMDNRMGHVISPSKTTAEAEAWKLTQTQAEALLLEAAWYIGVTHQLKKHFVSEDATIAAPSDELKRLCLYFSLLQLSNQLFFSLLWSAKQRKEDCQPWLNRLTEICDSAWALGERALAQKVVHDIRQLLHEVKSADSSINEESLLLFLGRQQQIEGNRISVDFSTTLLPHSEDQQRPSVIRQSVNILTPEHFSVNSESSSYQSLLDCYQHAWRDGLQTQMSRISDRLGQAPNPFAVIALGSGSNELRCHYSDVEFGIVLSGTSPPQHKMLLYAREWALWLEISTVLLGETPYPALSVRINQRSRSADLGRRPHSSILNFARAGLTFDTGGNVPPNPARMEIATTILASLASREILSTEDGSPEVMALSTATFLWGDETIYETFQTERHRIFTEKVESLYGDRPRAETLALHLMNGDLRRRRAIGNIGDIIDVKADLIRPVSFLVHTLALYYNVPAQPIRAQLDELVYRGYCHPLLAKLIKAYFSFMLTLRMQLHAYYQDEHDTVGLQESMARWHKTLLQPLQQQMQKFFDAAKAGEACQNIFLDLTPFAEVLAFWSPHLNSHKESIQQLRHRLSDLASQVTSASATIDHIQSQLPSKREEQRISVSLSATCNLDDVVTLRRFYNALLNNNSSLAQREMQIFINYFSESNRYQLFLEFLTQFIAAWTLKLVHSGTVIRLPLQEGLLRSELQPHFPLEMIQYDPDLLRFALESRDSEILLLQRIMQIDDCLEAETTDAMKAQRLQRLRIRALQDACLYLGDTAIQVLLSHVECGLRNTIATSIIELSHGLWEPVQSHHSAQCSLLISGLWTPFMLILAHGQGQVDEPNLITSLLSLCLSLSQRKVGLQQSIVYFLACHVVYEKIDVNILISIYQQLPFELHKPFCENLLLLSQHLQNDIWQTWVNHLKTQPEDPDGWEFSVWYAEELWARQLLADWAAQETETPALHPITITFGFNAQSETHLLNSEVTHQLFERVGDFQFKSKPKGQSGNHTVLVVTCGEQRYYCKLYPERPGTQQALHLFTNRLVGGNTPKSVIAKLSHSDGRCAAVQLFEEVEGTNLETVLNTYPEQVRKIDMNSFFAALIYTLIRDPEDDKPDGYFITPDHRLVSIDDERAFYQAEEKRAGIKRITQGSHRLIVKTIIYCLDHMKEVLDPEELPAIQRFLRLDLKVLMKNLIAELLQLHVRLGDLFTLEEVNFHFARTEPGPSLLVLALPTDLFDRITQLLEAIQFNISFSKEERSPLTGLLLLRLLQPTLAKHYNNSFVQHPSDNEQTSSALTRFTYLTAGEYHTNSVNGSRMSCLQGAMIFSKSLGGSCDLDESCISPVYYGRQLSVLQAMQQFERSTHTTITAESLAKEILNLDSEALQQLRQAPYRFRYLVAQLIFRQLAKGASSEQLQFIWTAMIGLPFAELILTGFGATLHASQLKLLLEGANVHLRKLELGKSLFLKDKDLELIAEHCPELSTLIIYEWNELKSIREHVFPKLRYFSVKSQPLLEKIQIRAPKLERFRVEKCPSLTELAFDCDWVSLNTDFDNSFSLQTVEGIDWEPLQRVKTIFKPLESEKRVSELTLNNQMISASFMIPFTYALKHDHWLVSLNLTANLFGVEGAELLGSVFAQQGARALRDLNVSDNNFGDKGVQYIVEGLKQHPLNTCNLSNTTMTGKGLLSVSGIFSSHAHLKVLIVDQNPLGMRGAEAFKSILSKNSVLEELSASETNIDDTALNILITTMKESHLRSLSLARNLITVLGATALISKLRENTYLSTLNLSGNQILIDSENIPHWQETFKINRTLQRIDLSHNSLDAKGLAGLLLGVYYNMMIKEFNVENNMIDASTVWILTIFTTIAERNKNIAEHPKNTASIVETCHIELSSQFEHAIFKRYVHNDKTHYQKSEPLPLPTIAF